MLCGALKLSRNKRAHKEAMMKLAMAERDSKVRDEIADEAKEGIRMSREINGSLVGDPLLNNTDNEENPDYQLEKADK